MMPTTDQILKQLMRASQLHPDFTVSEIAEHLGFPPLFIINALALGEESDALQRILEDDKIIVAEHAGFDYGDDITRLREEIMQLIQAQNAKETDVETGLVARWLTGVRPLSVELALDAIVKDGQLASYDLADPKDKKSVYTFLTMPENLEHKWGVKQFKDQPEPSEAEEN